MAKVYHVNPNKRKSIMDMSDAELRLYKKEKAAYLRRKQAMLRIVFTCLLVLGLTLSFHGIATRATNSVDDAKFQYFNTYTVAYGDTLWSISEQQNLFGYKNAKEYMNEVAKMNHLDLSGNIAEGQVLILPFYSSEYHE